MEYKNDLLSAHLRKGLREELKDKFILTKDWLKRGVPKVNPSVQFLYGHYLFKDELPGYQQVMDYLQTHFKIISYSEAVSRVSQGNIDDFYICFSFDDGIKNCMRIAEDFYLRGISAAFFLNPMVLDRAKEEGFIKQHCEERLHLKELDFMSWKEAEKLLRLGHEVGNHTLSHQRLSEFRGAPLHEEIVLAKELLEKQLGKVQHFAWTYGKESDISAEALEIIWKSGHSSIASAIRGQHFQQLDLQRHYLYRDLIFFKDPVAYFRYFYRQANRLV